MPLNAVVMPNFRDFFVLAPELVLALWGLVLLMVDLTVLRRRPGPSRQAALGRLSLLGLLAALAAALLPVIVRFDLYGLGERLNFAGIDYVSHPDPMLFFNTLSGDFSTELFNLLYIVLLALVVRLSTVWSFTENWGEYFALLFWSTVGMMLLTASEELLTLFLTLETMTICLYLITAFETSKRRSSEGGLKYFVYGSVSSALFLYGLSLIYGLTGSTQFSAIRAVLNPTYGDAVGLSGNLAGVTAVLLMMVGFGFKVAAVPFHQWAPDAYEGAPAPVAAWIATGSKIASFVALMKILLMALGPWASPAYHVMNPGWIGIVVVLAAASMTFGNFAALAQRNLKRMLAYSSIAHAGYMLVGVAAVSISKQHQKAAGAILFYLVIYAFSNIGAFAVAAWLARDKDSDEIDDLNGLAHHHPALATCILLLMLSLIGMPPLAGFFGKLYMFMEALNEPVPGRPTLAWLVALGLLNSVVSAFYYVRVLKAMFLRPPDGARPLAPPTSAVSLPIFLATAIVVGFGIYPDPLITIMQGAAVQMLSSSGLIGKDAVQNRLKATPEAAPVPSPAQVTPTPPPPDSLQPTGPIPMAPAPLPDTQPQPKPAAKVEPRAEPKPETKPAPKPEPKPAPRPPAAPKPKPEPKPGELPENPFSNLPGPRDAPAAKP